MGRNDNSRRSKGRNWGRNRDRNEKNNERTERNERSERKERNRAEKNHAERGQQKQRPQYVRQFANTITKKEIAENEDAIRAYRADTKICEICGKPIEDIDTAIANRGTGSPVHFDCVLARLAETETVGQNDKITYIGQGKFAVLHFDNIHDMRHFTIKKEIEWESRDAERSFWRNDMAGLYSQVK
ncbi:MAG: hypothetical protein K6G80_05460 [Treponema sp.]|nr:hypothetical protein [Treponema sp.]